jgi:hypothetical protein
MVSILRLGALLLGAGSLLWGVGSLSYGDAAEAVWCSLVGVGWLVFAGGLWLAGPRRAAVSGAGLLVAAAGATHWMLDALAAGSPLSSWVLYGVGMELATVAALLLWSLPRWRSQVAWAFPPAFAAVLAAGTKLALGGLGGDLLNAAAVVLTLAGAVLVAVRPGPVYARALAPGPASA